MPDTDRVMFRGPSARSLSLPCGKGLNGDSRGLGVGRQRHGLLQQSQDSGLSALTLNPVPSSPHGFWEEERGLWAPSVDEAGVVKCIEESLSSRPRCCLREQGEATACCSGLWGMPLPPLTQTPRRFSCSRDHRPERDFAPCSELSVMLGRMAMDRWKTEA